jgi:hypothetical protein
VRHTLGIRQWRSQCASDTAAVRPLNDRPNPGALPGLDIAKCRGLLSARPVADSRARRRQRDIAQFASYYDRIPQGYLSPDGWGGRTMPAQIPRLFGAIAFASALLASGLGVSAPANTALAVDCLTAPNSAAPPNNHWYYRTDRTQQRKCWYIRADTEPSEQRTAQIAREAPMVRSSQSAPAAVPYSLASFKTFLAQHGGARLSDQDVEKLYTEFLEWNRRAKN